mmetsp:Transcript_44851/g.112774  ORF Transcript_44851/g.112774 Transcript_44851/m.112774 type:complete len:556 (-) Transcript_44851:166-1833(-)
MPKKEGRREEEDQSAGRDAKRRKLGENEPGEGVDESAVNGITASGGSGSRAAAQTPGAGDGSDSDDDAVAPAVAALLADSDAESASSSSSSSSSSDEEGGKAAEAPKPPAADRGAGDAERGTPAAESGGAAAGQREPEGESEQPAPPAPPAPASPSSESSSSSSSESESESEAGEAPGDADEADELEAAAREDQVAEVNQYHIVRRAILKRDELAKMVSGLPLEAAEEAILRSYVRLAVQAPGADQDNAACVLAEVVGIEPSPPYVVNRSDGQRVTLKLRLRCRRGSSQRLVKISSVSNHELTEMEHEQWKRLTARTGVDTSKHTTDMLKKALDIDKARNFRFDEKIVADMLRQKGDLEFDAQKESRMRFLVQCAMTQMDISNIRDNEARELEERYKESLASLHRQEAKSTEMQSQWFEKRPNLYSLKMINKKNYERQVRDDRHALDFTLANETSGKEGLNPFQRRACRPLVAWDVQLTPHEGLPTNAPKVADQSGAGEKAAEAKAAAPAQASSSSMDETPNGELPVNSENRMDRIVRAHSGARHILAAVSGISG